MRLEYLQYLMEIDRCRSISRAAQNLYIGQTTLSAILKNLEQELGFPIFDRVHNGVVPTSEGEEALSLIGGILSRYEDIQRLSGSSSSLAQTVHVISSPTINCALAVPLSSRFLESGANGNLVFHEIIVNPFAFYDKPEHCSLPCAGGNGRAQVPAAAACRK